MKLENQVCSLDLAKRLKELGVKQESLYYWSWLQDANLKSNIALVNKKQEDWFGDIASRTCYSAFTVAELGEMLPSGVKIDGRINRIISRKPDSLNSHIIELVNPDGRIYILFSADTEANARAKMVIYLLEKKLMKIPK